MLTIDKLPAGGYRLETSLRLRKPLQSVFPFFANARNLELITPPWLSFSVLTPEPIEMVEGTLIDYKLRLHGIPIRWRTRIAVWEPPFRFVDEQQRGPYRRWHHEHIFEAIGDETVAQDIVHYDPPGGTLLNWLIVGRDVRKIFEYRSKVLKARFQSAK